MATALQVAPARHALMTRFADKFEIDAANVMSIVASTIFKQGKDEAPLTADEVHAAILVCNQYDLNPFLKEIYAFRSKGKLLIYVSVDGWCKVINRQETLDGIEFEEHFDDKGKISGVTCKIHRKDRRLPIVVTEYWSECSRNTDPWQKSPIRMTRHRALVQCARVAFSISGIMDEEEAESIKGGTVMAGTPNGALIEGNTQQALPDPEPTIGKEKATAWYKTYRSSGHTPDDSKAYLKAEFGIEAPRNSADIPVSGEAKAFEWANTKAPVRLKVDELFEYLGWTHEECVAFVNEHKADWVKIAELAGAELDKRNAEEK
jgi:phage recombination protein Bet